MLTDHATHMGEADWDKLFLTDSGLGDEKIIEAGEQTGGKMNCPNGDGSHQVIITVGGENDLMPVGLHHHLGDTVSARKQAMSADTPLAVKAFHDAGGLKLQAHGESRDRTKMCTLAAAGLDGMEVYNLHANLDPKIRETYLGLDGLAAFAGLAPWLEARPVADGGPEPDLALLGFLEDNSIVHVAWKGLIRPDTNFNELLFDPENQKAYNLDNVIAQFRDARKCILGNDALSFDDL